ncbi:hypothetical protein VB775_19460 [Pseudanabaena sp. CCNP1317]|nr:hypothetical protein [Pseudanabaena sp. CCNP1317]
MEVTLNQHVEYDYQKTCVAIIERGLLPVRKSWRGFAIPALVS